MTFEEFKTFYEEKGYFPGGVYNTPGKKWNERQLKTKYDKYLKTIKRREEKKGGKGSPDDERWQAVREAVWERDEGECSLMKVLSPVELTLIKKHAPYNLLKTLDPAHCLAKSKYPKLYYKVENIYLLNRYSHSNLDEYRDPIFGLPIKKDEVDYWWNKILRPHGLTVEELTGLSNGKNNRRSS